VEEKAKKIADRLVGKVKVYQEGDEKHRNPFWYHGLIAKRRDKDARLIATGKVEIINTKSGRLVFDRKERNEGINLELEGDNDLRRVNEENGYRWVSNRWFALRGRDVRLEDSVCFDYYKALEMLKEV